MPAHRRLKMRFVEEIIERRANEYARIERRTARHTRQAVRKRIYEADRRDEQQSRADRRFEKSFFYFD